MMAALPGVAIHHVHRTAQLQVGFRILVDLVAVPYIAFRQTIDLMGLIKKLCSLVVSAWTVGQVDWPIY